MDIKVNLEAIKKASEDLSNWGRWGKDDQIGTLNLVRPDDIIEASKLIKKGKVFPWEYLLTEMDRKMVYLEVDLTLFIKC